MKNKWCTVLLQTSQQNNESVDRAATPAYRAAPRQHTRGASSRGCRGPSRSAAGCHAAWLQGSADPRRAPQRSQAPPSPPAGSTHSCSCNPHDAVRIFSGLKVCPGYGCWETCRSVSCFARTLHACRAVDVLVNRAGCKRLVPEAAQERAPRAWRARRLRRRDTAAGARWPLPCRR